MYDDDDESDDDHLPMWEQHAHEAVDWLIENAEFDDVRGVIVFPASNDDEHRFGTECSTLEEVQQHLSEAYDQEWYNYVPFDGGEAVFEGDSWDAVDTRLVGDNRISNFFDRHAQPPDTEELALAGQLLLDQNAARQIRVSLEDINDELVVYLAAHPHMMREMEPRRFEELVAAMFRNQGYDVTLTPRSNDGGMDVIAVQRDGIGTAMIIVECKRYAAENKVGVEIVRGLYGVVEEQRATKGIIATTSFFTRGANEFQSRVPFRLALADFNTLQRELGAWRLRIGR